MFTKTKKLIFDEARHNELEIKIVTALFQPAFDQNWSDEKRVMEFIEGNSEFPKQFLDQILNLAAFYNYDDYNPVLSAALWMTWDVFNFSSMRISRKHFTEEKYVSRTVTGIRKILATTAIQFADGNANIWGSYSSIKDYEEAIEYGLEALEKLREEIAKKKETENS